VEDENGLRLQFPAAPAGVDRMEHLPTVEARIRYWNAVRRHAIRTSNLGLELTARNLQTAYEEARQARQPAEEPTQQSEASFGRRGRLPPAT
jgi:hypothetical protein